MSLIDVGLYFSYLLIGICALTAIVMPLIQSFSDPKSLMKSGVGLGALVLVFVVSYALANPEAAGASESTSKYVGAGIISTYVFFFGALIGIVITEISKIIK